MAGVAIFIAQIPVLVILAGLAFVATKLTGVPASAYITGLPFAGLSSAMFFLPVKNKIFSRFFAVLAAIGFSANDWKFLIAGLLSLIAADRISGPLVREKKRIRFPRLPKGLFLVAAINWRALRMRVVLPTFLSLPSFGAAWLFITNNDPSSLLAGQVIRFSGAMGLVLFCAIMANLLASRRPPWPWIRALPWTARTRILSDSIFIAIHTLPLIILLGIMNIKSVLPILLSLPALAVYSASAIRKAPGSKTGALGNVLLTGTLASLLLCLIPWSSLGILALTPWLLQGAVKAEKNQQVSQWLELHHLDAGDSLSWSTR
jgi:hypothetical protein